MRPIQFLRQNTQQHWVGNGFPVRALFSHMDGSLPTDPFLMLDYAAPYEFSAGSRIPRGVGQHPHKGFETVTLAFQGEVAHRDSGGDGGVIRAGDVQWMTAGSGIIHDEFHSPEFLQQGGTLEMVQLWVNLPARNKSAPPRYQHLAKDNIPVVELADGAGSLRVVAGQYQDVRGAADTFTELNVWDIRLNAGKQVELEVPPTHSLMTVVLHGKVLLNNGEYAEDGTVVGYGDGSRITLAAEGRDAHILLLSGVPIGEPIAAYGPFVMNTEAEIHQAFSDFQAGRFGEIAA